MADHPKKTLTLAALARRQDDLEAENRALREQVERLRANLANLDALNLAVHQKLRESVARMREETQKDIASIRHRCEQAGLATQGRFRELEAALEAEAGLVREAAGRFDTAAEAIGGDLEAVREHADQAVERVKALLARPPALDGIGPAASALPLLPDHIVVTLAYDAKRTVDIWLVRDDDVWLDMSDLCALWDIHEPGRAWSAVRPGLRRGGPGSGHLVPGALPTVAALSGLPPAERDAIADWLEQRAVPAAEALLVRCGYAEEYQDPPRDIITPPGSPLPVMAARIGGRRVQAVDARCLHGLLQEPAPFLAWFERVAEGAALREDRDYLAVEWAYPHNQGRSPVDHFLTIDAALAVLRPIEGGVADGLRGHLEGAQGWLARREIRVAERAARHGPHWPHGTAARAEGGKPAPEGNPSPQAGMEPSALGKALAFAFAGHDVRGTWIDGEPWWVVQDVLGALGYAVQGGVGKYVNHVPDQWKGGNRISTPGGVQEMLLISEQGLYFFLGRSDKPKALPFQMHYAGEVLPMIRKTGHYEDSSHAGHAPTPAPDLPRDERPTGLPVGADVDPILIFPADGLLRGFMGEVGGQPQPVVDARELHGFLGSKDKFADWITDQIARARLKENKHFAIYRKKPVNSSGKGRPRIDYHLTLQGAQHLAMISNTEKGYEVRDYFIECEERYRELCRRPAASPGRIPNNPGEGRPLATAAPDPDPDAPRVFHFGDWPVRAVMADGRPWFVARDALRAVGHPRRDVKNVSQAVVTVPADERSRHRIVSDGFHGAAIPMVTLTAHGLRALLERSGQPGAAGFLAWLEAEVLPTYRAVG